RRRHPARPCRGREPAALLGAVAGVPDGGGNRSPDRGPAGRRPDDDPDLAVVLLVRVPLVRVHVRELLAGGRDRGGSWDRGGGDHRRGITVSAAVASGGGP